jgi:two-component system, NtrC family, sensor kinase
MQRHGGSRQPAKGRRTLEPEARKAAKSASADHSPEQFDQLKRERDEALEQQTATSEVLKVISSSPGELQPVFEAVLANAMRICEAKFGHLSLYDGERFQSAYLHNAPPSYREFWERGPVHPSANTGLGRVARTKEVVHIPDLKADSAYAERDPLRVAAVERAGTRTCLFVPMLKENRLVGAIAIYRKEVRPFTDKQIAFATNFAAQAVIAIENTRLLNELRQRTDDLSESLERQKATSEVLGVISQSTSNLQPVVNTIAATAARLCQSDWAVIFKLEKDGKCHLVANNDADLTFIQYLKNNPITPSRNSTTGRAVVERRTIHVHDVLADPEWARPDSQAIGKQRTLLSVPLLREGMPIGVISLARTEVKPYTDKQIELVTTFADQAVIAIENVRLFEAEQARTGELTESLQQQTATADVLKVISSTPGDLQPVFDTMLAKATDLCQASYGTMWLSQRDGFRTVAMYGGLPPAWVEQWRSGTPYRPLPNRPLARVAELRQPIQITDLREDQSYLEGDPLPVAAVEIAGIRTLLAVPMFKENELVGAIAIYRKEVRPFTDKQIALVTNFAAQAVIAIENTRLLNELRESLQQQTATADVLKVISRSTFDLKSVLNTLLEAAARLCEADSGTIALPKGKDVYQHVASYRQPAALDAELTRTALKVGKGSLIGRTALHRAIVHILDVQKDPDYELHTALKIGDYHTMLGIPLLREGNLVGVLGLARQTVRPFTEKQIELVTTFADQAVIAIENARLFEEVQKRTEQLTESLQQQTATADVLKVISRSAFDLRTVLQTLVESAARFCNADKANVIRERNGAFYSAESYGFSQELMEYLKDIPIDAERGTASGRALLEGRVVHIADVKADPEYTLVEGQRLGDYRTILSVPMLREGAPIGVLTLLRSEIQPFTDKQIELVTTFADQAAIAIENVRLFESVETRTSELAQSLEDLRTTQDRLVQTQKLASLGQLTAGIAHEIKNPLNFVNNFSGVSVELIDELRQALAGANLDSKLRAEVSEIADTLQGNLDKVVQHGKRADAIVKNMLLHSREGSGEHRLVDINSLVEESLNLAWHGARAEKQGFNITMERSLDPAAGEADVFPQDITRALLNLISNGFYAATKRSAEGNGGDYEPTLVAATRNLGDRVEIRIRDNGTGIPLEVKEKIFNPFFTTKPAGEGTGLGLSISHDIIVKQHAGSIEVDTQLGEFTEIRVILPRTAVFV